MTCRPSIRSYRSCLEGLSKSKQEVARVIDNLSSICYDDPMTKNPSNKIFGPLLRAKRLKRGFGLLELANLAGMDATQLSRMETGQRLPPELPGLVVLANKLGINANSEEFSELLAAADQDRNPALHKMALEMRGGKSWNPFRQLERNEVTCSSLGELV